MPNALRLTGQVFGELTVVRRVGRTSRGYTLWLCRCSCGEELEVSAAKLREGVKRVCSRAKPEHRIYTSLVRGHELTYASWGKMRERCLGVRGKANKNYGRRGIKICERWNSFEKFLKDMGDRPGPEYSIERLDVNGDYEPNNCKWGTDQEQRRNKRRSIYVEWDGRTWFLKDLCEEFGLRYSVVAGRYRGLGWPLERALTQPVGKKA